ncbi:MAG TPA: hypothetical protein ENJ84_01495 [Gammaproteobacteria bacterium]|nr:hypothetical protein [Gammaproteobacteria bacterium]
MNFIYPMFFLLLFFLSGCETVPIQDDLSSSDEQVNSTVAAVNTQDSVILMRVHIKNVFKPNYQPKINYIQFKKRGEKNCDPGFEFGSSEEIPNENCYSIEPSNRQVTISDEPEEGTDYLVKQVVVPGVYKFTKIVSSANSGLIFGRYTTSINKTINVSVPGVYYLGDVDVTLRPRKKGEPRAGSVFPILDQRVSGAAGGTFDILVTDGLDEFKNEIVSLFPELSNLDINKAILPFSNHKSESIKKCSVGQVLSMKNSGLSDEQVERACE